MVCQRCCAIANKLHKYRNNAISNDRILKEQCGQLYKPPPTEREDIERIDSILIKELFTLPTYGSERENHYHPSVSKLYKQYKNIILSKDISKSDVSPVVSLNSSEVTDWYEERAIKFPQTYSILWEETPVTVLKETARKKTQSSNFTRKRWSQNDEDEVLNKKWKSSSESDSLDILDNGMSLSNYIRQEYFYMDSENVMSTGALLTAHLCTHCNKWFDTPEQLMRHQKMHLICKFCKMKLQSIELLHQHQNESCYINIIKSLPTIPLTKIDSVQSVIEKYPEAFLGLNIIKSETEDVDIPSEIMIKDSDYVTKETDRLRHLINDSFAKFHIDKNLNEKETVLLLFDKYFNSAKNKSLQTDFTPDNPIQCSASNYIELHNLITELKKYKISVVFECKPRISAKFQEHRTTSSNPVVYCWENKKITSLTKSNEPSVIIDLSNDEDLRPKPGSKLILLQHLTGKSVRGSLSNKKSYQPLISQFGTKSLQKLNYSLITATTKSPYLQTINPSTNSVTIPPLRLLPRVQKSTIFDQSHMTQNSTTATSNGAQPYNFIQVLPNSTLFSDLTQATAIKQITQPSSTSASSQSNIQDSTTNPLQNSFLQILESSNLFSYFPNQPPTQLNQLSLNQQSINDTNMNNNILVLAPPGSTSKEKTQYCQTPIETIEESILPVQVSIGTDTNTMTTTTYKMVPAQYCQAPIQMVDENVLPVQVSTGTDTNTMSTTTTTTTTTYEMLSSQYCQTPIETVEENVLPVQVSLCTDTNTMTTTTYTMLSTLSPKPYAYKVRVKDLSELN